MKRRPKDDVLMAGHMSLHDVFLIHGSRANRSTKRLAGLTFRYMPSTSHFDRSIPAYQTKGLVADFATRPLFLVRGVNRNPQNDLEIGHVCGYKTEAAVTKPTGP